MSTPNPERGARPRGAPASPAHHLALAALVTALGACEGGPAPPPPAPPADARAIRFTDVTEAAGLDFEHENGAAGAFLLPEIMGGGAGMLDADGDGRLDLYLVQSGPLPGAPVAREDRPGNRLFRNEGEGRFADVTAWAGVGDRGYGMGCAAGDYDNDGDVDLYVTNLGPNVLYRNRGDGTFEDVTAIAGAGDHGWSTSAAFADLDADGDLDLFVVNYVDWADTPAFTGRTCYALSGVPDYCSPQAYDARSADTLYRNEGDGTFVDVSAEAGLLEHRGTGLGVVAADLDGDGRVDVYVANDQMPSFAWMNRGACRFEERAAMLGVAVDQTGRPQAGMGVDAADIDDDGDVDLWKVHLHRETHILYVNQGDYFDDVTIRWGLAAPTRRHTGFGTALVDLDLDGRLDTFVANGRVQDVGEVAPEGADVYAEPDQILRQSRPGWFEDVTASAGPALALVENSRAAAFGDYDDDGDVDVLVASCNGPARLLRNDTPRRGGFLSLRVLDRHGRDAFGARVTCSVHGRTRTGEVRAAYGYCATNDPRVHVGLGPSERVERVEVRWPGGATETYGPFPAGTFQVLREAGPGGRPAGSGRP